MVRNVLYSTAVILLISAAAAKSQEMVAPAAASRNAQALAGARAASVGLRNFHRVDRNFYRSAQPEGQRAIEFLVRNYGIRTIISLKRTGSDRLIAQGHRLQLQKFAMEPGRPDHDAIVSALRALRLATRQGPTLLHCQHGSDRTGLITALYRILYQGWSKEAAIREMLDPALGFNAIWGSIPRYVKQVDIAQLRREVGVN